MQTFPYLAFSTLLLFLTAACQPNVEPGTKEHPAAVTQSVDYERLWSADETLLGKEMPACGDRLSDQDMLDWKNHLLSSAKKG